MFVQHLNIINMNTRVDFETAKLLRNVMFKQWIDKQYIGEGSFRRVKEGTNCWEKEFTTIGVFHQWASAYESFESGAGNYTVALIELPNGEMKEVLPSNVKFISKELCFCKVCGVETDYDLVDKLCPKCW
jgi:hypothetical protein